MYILSSLRTGVEISNPYLESQPLLNSGKENRWLIIDQIKHHLLRYQILLN